MIFVDFRAHPFLIFFENRNNDADLMSSNPNDLLSVWNEYDLPTDSLRHIIAEHRRVMN